MPYPESFLIILGLQWLLHYKCLIRGIIYSSSAYLGGIEWLRVNSQVRLLRRDFPDTRDEYMLNLVLHLGRRCNASTIRI